MARLVQLRVWDAFLFLHVWVSSSKYVDVVYTLRLTIAYYCAGCRVYTVSLCRGLFSVDNVSLGLEYVM